LTPLKVEVRLPKKNDPEWKIVHILKDCMPIEGIRDLDIVGIDGYNLDESKTSKSLGGIIVLRRNDQMRVLDDNQFRGKIPILTYYKRPPRKEQFWEIGLKVSILYNAIKNTMIGVDSDSMIGYYKSMGCKKYLSPRPKSFESDKSEQTHEFGYKDTNYSIPRRLSAMQTWIEDNIMHCWMPELVKDCIAYNEVIIGSDYDLADALGHALVRIQDMKRIPDTDMNSIGSDVVDRPEWEEDSDGNIIIIENPHENRGRKEKSKEEVGGWERL